MTDSLGIDALIDQFVEKVNHAPKHRIREEDIPLQLREGGAQYGLYYNWAIQKFQPIHWIEILESQLPSPLPPSYRSLVTRYIFPAFEVPPLQLLANTGQDIYHEMMQAVLHDRVMSKVLMKKGFAQFARPNNRAYDPVCFDFKRRQPNGEYPIVRINHEEILANATVTVVEEMAPSFLEFVKQYLEGEKDLLLH